MNPAQAQAQAQAQTRLAHLAEAPDLVVVTFGTTDVDGDIIQFTLTDQAQMLFNGYADTTCTIAKGAADLHGITREFLVNHAEDYGAVLNAFVACIGTRPVATFGLQFAAAALRRRQTPQGVPDTSTWVCLQTLAEQRYGSFHPTSRTYARLSLTAAMAAAGLRRQDFAFPRGTPPGNGERAMAFIQAHRAQS